jgi:hypothetical protein
MRRGVTVLGRKKGDVTRCSTSWVARAGARVGECWAGLPLESGWRLRAAGVRRRHPRPAPAGGAPPPPPRTPAPSRTCSCCSCSGPRCGAPRRAAAAAASSEWACPQVASTADAISICSRAAAS